MQKKPTIQNLKLPIGQRHLERLINRLIKNRYREVRNGKPLKPKTWFNKALQAAQKKQRPIQLHGAAPAPLDKGPAPQRPITTPYEPETAD